MPHDLEFAKQSPVPATAAELFDWHARPGAFTRLAPPWARIEVLGDFPEIVDGTRVTLRMAKGPLRVRWIAEHRRVRPGVGFRDVQVKGPFALWEHDHLFEPVDGGGAMLHDRIRFRPPGGALGRLLMAGSLRRDLRRTFAYRHATTVADLDLHASYRDRPRLKVAITGAGGLVGRTLSGLLTTGGHEVLHLVRAGNRRPGPPRRPPRPSGTRPAGCSSRRRWKASTPSSTWPARASPPAAGRRGARRRSAPAASTAPASWSPRWGGCTGRRGCW